MIKAVIFDLDGLLIDSEPLWRDAEVDIFSRIGVSLNHEMTHQTMGLRVDEVVEYWYRKQPWQKISKKDVANQIDRKVIELVTKEGKALPGVIEVLNLFKSKKLPIAVASSSSLSLINTVLNKFGISDDISVVCSAHNELYGKPHPAVFLRTLDELNLNLDTSIHSEQCLVFEDSINGIIAAKAAKMKCIAVPQSELNNDKRLGIADYVIKSLSEFKSDLLDIV